MKHIIRLFVLIAALVHGADHAWANAESNPRVKFVYVDEQHGTAFASEADNEGNVTITVTPEGDWRCIDGDLTAEQSVNSTHAEGRRLSPSENPSKGVTVPVTCVETNEFTLTLPADVETNVTVYVKFSEKGTFTPTVSIENWTYGDDANEPSLGESNTSGGGVTYTYADTQDGSYDTNVPTQAGFFWVKATVAATADYKECVSAPVQFQIDKKAITINEASANVVEKEYDGTNTATLSGTFSFNDGMIVGSDDVSIDANGVSATFEDQEAGSDKLVTVTGFVLTGANMNNYILTNPDFYIHAAISKKDLTVTANNHTIYYGEVPDNSGVTYNGFIEGEDETTSNIFGESTLTYAYNKQADGLGTSYTTSIPVGKYYIIPSGLTSDNYNIDFRPGTLTVNQKATISVDWEDNNNVGGLRPGSLEFKLLANGSETGRTITLNEGNNWSETLNGLTPCNGTDLIQYTWILETTPVELSNNYEWGEPTQNTLTTGATATFTLTRKTGSLTVANTLVSDLTTDANVEFTYTVKLTNANINGTYGGMEFTDGEATFTLKGGENKAATLMYGTTYTVEQHPEEGFTTSPKVEELLIASGTISTSSTQATFTNTRQTGSLTVSNNVESDLAADADVEFTFTVTLGDKSINGTYGSEENAMTFAGGVATFKLKKDQYKTATGLPTTLTYTVTQADVEGFTITDKDGDTGTISTTQSDATFTNTRQTGSLKVTNTVASDLAADKTVDFEFTVTLGDTSISKTYGGMTFADGVATFNLKDAEFIEATGLPTTLTYTVTQEDASGFDITDHTGDTGTISTTQSDVEFTNTRQTGNLTVMNTLVSVLAADADEEFTFTVNLGDNNINGTYGIENSMTFTDGVATFTLKGGEYKTATGLPTTLTYTVTQAFKEGFTTSPEDEQNIFKATGTISTTASEATFTNTRETGDLTVTNTVVSVLEADANEEFTFTVNLGDDNINGTYGGMEFTDGVATFTLTGQTENNSKTATGLPTTLDYTVEQTAVEGFTTSPEDEQTHLFKATGAISTTLSQATFTNTRQMFTITFKNEDGTVLQSTDVAYGQTPTAPADPTKDATAQYTYTFAGWTPNIEDVTGDATYTATYNSTVNKYTVTFVDENGTTVLKEATAYDYGTAAADIVLPDDPTKDATAQYTYAFAGWTPNIEDVTGDATYTATYSSTVNKYTVTFVDEDGTEISSADYDYGTAAANIVLPDDPTKADTEQFTYTFAGWDQAVADVTADAVYTATYTWETRQYRITWHINDGEERYEDYYYGETPSYSGMPTKDDDAQYHYTFAGWSPSIEMVTADATYTATYTAEKQYYLITWLNDDDSVIDETCEEYGVVPTPPADPTKDATAQYSYTFAGWSPEVITVTGDATYKATYSSTLRTSGNCGQTGDNGSDVRWSYDTTTKTLTISGTGEMMYYGSAQGSDTQWHSTAPWSHFDSEIETVTVGSGVTYIGSYAFAYCPALTSVSLPASVIALGDYVCYSSGVTRIDIPSATAAATLGTGGFDATPAALQIAVPAHLLKTYKEATNWSAYAVKMVGVLDDAHDFNTGDGTPTGSYEYSRTFNEGVAATICLPFEVSSDQISSYGQVYTFDGVDKSGEKWEVVMKEANKASGALTAYKPYLFLPYIFNSKGTNLPLKFSGNVSSIAIAGTDNWEEDSSTGSFWSFQGVTYYYEWNEGHENLGKVYGFAARNYDGGSYTVNPGDFVKALAGASIKPFRAFLQFTPSSNSRMTRGANDELPATMSVRLISANGTPTAIGTLDTSTGEVTFDEEWYSLDGRKLNGKPSKHGIYISNGKKVFIRDKR